MYGTPVLGANIGGIPELIRVGETGELFESGNEKQLGQKIWELWNDHEKTAMFAERCSSLTFSDLEQYSGAFKDICYETVER